MTLLLCLKAGFYFSIKGSDVAFLMRILILDLIGLSDQLSTLNLIFDNMPSSSSQSNLEFYVCILNHFLLIGLLVLDQDQCESDLITLISLCFPLYNH